MSDDSTYLVFVYSSACVVVGRWFALDTHTLTLTLIPHTYTHTHKHTDRQAELSVRFDVTCLHSFVACAWPLILHFTTHFEQHIFSIISFFFFLRRCFSSSTLPFRFLFHSTITTATATTSTQRAESCKIARAFCMVIYDRTMCICVQTNRV